MRVGVDSYSYHRRFGEVRPSESPVDIRWDTVDFVEHCAEFGVDGVSLETCYMDLHSSAQLDDISAAVRSHDLAVAVAWGHPGGLEMGTSPDALCDALHAADVAARLDAELLRIVVGVTEFFGREDEAVVVERLTPQVREIVLHAAGNGIPVAVETHCDLTVGGLEGLLSAVGHPNLGVVLDTANVVRIGDDPVRAARVFAGVTRMVHAKDLDLSVSAEPGDPGGWWACVSLGTGDVDLAGVFGALSDAGFDGLACVEVADVPEGADEDQIVEESIRWLRTAGGPARAGEG